MFNRRMNDLILLFGWFQSSDFLANKVLQTTSRKELEIEIFIQADKTIFDMIKKCNFFWHVDILYIIHRCKQNFAIFDDCMHKFCIAKCQKDNLDEK